MKKLALAGTLLMGVSGCSCRIPLPPPAARIQTRSYTVLYRHPLEVRFSKVESAVAGGVLVIYSTGDGGWRGLDNKMFNWIGALGYPVAGFSSRGYLKNLGHFSDTDTTTPRRLARDFQNVITFAEGQLGLPLTTPVILVGNSRGAGLSVVAAGQGGLMARLAGVVAIALTREEEHVLHYRRSLGRAAEGVPKREWAEIKTYEYLPRLAHFPVAVIQSEHDGYLPAEAARELFGPDTTLHKLHRVSARNHSFRGGCADLYQELDGALRWIVESTEANRASNH